MLCLVPRLLTAAGLPVRINDVIRWLEHGRGLSYTCPLGLGVTFLETQLASAPLGPDFLGPGCTLPLSPPPPVHFPGCLRGLLVS